MEGWDVWGYEEVGTDCEDQLSVLPGTVRHLKCFGKGLVGIAGEQKMDDGKGNKLPFWECKCTNPDCKGVKEKESSSKIQEKLTHAIQELGSATRELKLCYKNFRQEIKRSYSFSCKDGIKELYPELCKRVEELKKIVAKIEAIENQGVFNP